ncbi:MAG: carbohydrate kinase [Bacteroidales bacterium]|nr:carbohydrate kinase [Bacteroidales bacterium]
MQHIYAVGETILDIIFRENQPKAAKPGGSSFNASITLGRLGAPITFISEMGNDRVGDLIQDFLEENGVDSNYMSRYENGQSAIALAFLNDKSDAEYQFYKDYPHQRLNVEFPELQKDDLLMFGSFYALNPGIRPRVKELLDKARRAGTMVIYDPNFRSTHAPNRDDLLSVIKENMDYATIVRASDEDLVNIFNVNNPDDAWKQIRPHCSILIYTANVHGVHLRTEGLEVHMDVERIEPVSTIGAGDTFNAGLLYGIYRNGYKMEQISSLGSKEWEQLLKGAIDFSREVCLSYDNYLPTIYADKVKQNHLMWKKED